MATDAEIAAAARQWWRCLAREREAAEAALLATGGWHDRVIERDTAEDEREAAEDHLFALLRAEATD